MYKIRSNTITTYDISMYLNKPTCFNKDFEIKHPSSLKNISENSIVFVEQLDYQELRKIKYNCLILTNSINLNLLQHEDIVPDLLLTDNPEKDFYLIIKEFFIQEEKYEIHSSVVLSQSIAIGLNVSIGEGTIIGENVSIGNNTYIGKNTIINDNISIGSNCYIKDSSIIGSESFNFIHDDDKLSYIPFLGRLVIENDVWIGSNVILERPLLETKYIGSGVKIDDLIQIGSDTSIRENTQIAAGSIIGRNVSIGSNCILGINTVIKPNITIQDNVVTGIGAVVITDLESNNTYVGNPAKKMKA